MKPSRWRIKFRLLCTITFGICQLLHAGRLELSLSDGWRFELAEDQTNLAQPDPSEVAVSFDDSKWEKVFLPHTPRIEQPEQAQNYFQGICWYRRHIAPDPVWHGKKSRFCLKAQCKLPMSG